VSARSNWAAADLVRVPHRLICRHPAAAVLAGAAWTSLNGVFIEFARVSTATVVAFRCLLALPFLALLALWESRQRGRLPARAVVAGLLGGALLGADFALSTQALKLVGVGVSTVLTNIQIVVVPLLAWLILRARVSRSFVVVAPVFLFGIALLGGGLDGTEHLAGIVMSLGAGVAYAGYLFVLGQSRASGHPATTLCLATVSAGVTGTAMAAVWGDIDLSPGWGSLGWLAALALGGQLVGWMLIAYGLPRLPAEVGATLLALQPVGAVVSGIALLGERPSTTQLAGCIVIVAAVWWVNRAAAAPVQ
jgi:drug/metabolite transporter (DMT)-like permease